MRDTANPAQQIRESVPAHVEDTVQAVARFHSAHEAEAGQLQRAIERLTRRGERQHYQRLDDADEQGSWAARTIRQLLPVLELAEEFASSPRNDGNEDPLRSLHCLEGRRALSLLPNETVGASFGTCACNGKGSWADIVATVQSIWCRY